MRKFAVPGFVLAVLALTACSSSAGFEKDDPEAHSACTKFLVDPVMEDVADDEEIVMVLGTALAVGEHASKATTPEIQATAEELSGTGQWTIDEEALIQACEDAGYEVDEHSVAAVYLAQN